MALYLTYFGICILHLVFCSLGKQLPRRISKCLLLPLLLFAYCSDCSYGKTFFAASRIDVCTLTIVALVFAWIGDIVLINANVYKFRIAGSALFAVEHILNILSMFSRVSSKPDPLTCVLSLLFCLGIILFLYYRLQKIIPKPMKLNCLVYFILLGIAAASSFICRQAGGVGIGCSIGYLLFIASDSILVHQWFTVLDPEPRHDFWVMLTYCAAQFLIVFAMR